MKHFFKTLLPMYVGYGTIIAAASMIVLLVYWNTKVYEPFILNTEVVTVSPKEVRSGEELNLTFDFCKNVEAIDRVQLRIVSDEVTHSLPSYSAVVDKGCHHIDTQVTIPRVARLGIYHLEYIITHKVNPIKDVETVIRTEDFTVIAPLI